MQFDENSEDHDRNKKVEGERNYGCPCGKKYLSYPALFTHVKQKHEGKAPGQLIKPKTQKTRGRPRINSINNDSEPQQSIFDFYEELSRILTDVAVPQGQFQFEFSQGKRSCNDMMSEFLSAFDSVESERKTLKVFVCYIKTFVQKKYGEKYWYEQNPSQIIDSANQITKQLPKYKQKFCLQKKLVIDLTYILFKWMYKYKWTDHKLIRRSSDSTTNQN